MPIHQYSTVLYLFQSPNFSTFKEPRNLFQGINSASLCSLAVLYDNSIPSRFLAPIDCLKIPAQVIFIWRDKTPVQYKSFLINWRSAAAIYFS